MQENFQDSTCRELGSYDMIYRCEYCDAELQSEHFTVEKKAHTPDEAVIENLQDADCITEGSYDEAVYCTVCQEEISRTARVIPTVPHAQGVLDGAYEATETEAGYTGNLICPVCNTVLEYGEVIAPIGSGEVDPTNIVDYVNKEIQLDNEVQGLLSDLAGESVDKAAEILDVVNSTVDYLKEQLDSGAMTEEEYRNGIEVVQAATEAAITIGAKSSSAAEEGNKLNGLIPESTGVDMGSIVGDFYDRQLSAILGKDSEGAGIDLTLSPDTYRDAISFMDDTVSKMSDAALLLRECSGEQMVSMVKDYITTVSYSTFRDFDKAAADEEFLQQAYDAILLNMQQHQHQVDCTVHGGKQIPD